LIRKGERSGLLTRTATMDNSIVRADEKLTAFLELERRFVWAYWIEQI
jgi:hypothetical protein